MTFLNLLRNEADYNSELLDEFLQFLSVTLKNKVTSELDIFYQDET